MDWLKNLYQQYLQSDIPAASLLRGDTSEFLPSVNRNLDQNLSLLSTPEGAMDLVNPMAKVGGLLGRIAYHGSPYKFDKFDASKIGTGEGAQSFGHGLYFAENPNVAKSYVSASPFKGNNAKELPEQAWEELSPIMQKHNIPGDMPIGKDEVTALNEMLFEHSKKMTPTERAVFEKWGGSKGRLYKVDIPDEYIPKMIDWDKPLGQQSSEIKKAIENTKKDLTENNMADLDGNMSLLYGDDVSVSQFLNTWHALEGSRDAGEKLLGKYGVKGVKYLDGGSRAGNRSTSTSNYVVFDPTNIQILERK